MNHGRGDPGLEKYIDERRRKFPKQNRLAHEREQKEQLSRAGALQNDISNQPAVQYTNRVSKDGIKVVAIKSTPKIINYFMRSSQHMHNSHLLEAIRFIEDESFLQGGVIPEEYLYDYNTLREVTLELPQRDLSESYSYYYTYSSDSDSISSTPHDGRR